VSSSIGGGFDVDIDINGDDDDDDDDYDDESPSSESTTTTTTSTTTVDHPSSHIYSIKSSNIAGMINDGYRREEGDDTTTATDNNDDNKMINIDLGSKACLVAITGESGSGKSLLVSKAIDLITGGKAVSSLVPTRENNGGGDDQDNNNSSSVEVAAKLYEPQLTAVSNTLQKFGINPSILFNDEQQQQQSRDDDDCIYKYNDNCGHLYLKRTLISNYTTGGRRLKSVCKINNKHISLKTLRQIASPLFTRVDVGVASSALGRPASRLIMLDMGVPDVLKRFCCKLRDGYKGARKCREGIVRELESRVLPSSLRRDNNSGNDNAGFDEEQIELLEHWVDELDSFETRISLFQEAILAQYNDLLSDGSNSNNGSGNGGIVTTLQKLQKSTWGKTPHSDSTMISNDDDGDSLFANLIDFREEMKTVEMQLVSAQSAYESLASLSSPNSALVALENTRKLLYSISRDDCSGGGASSGNNNNNSNINNPLFDTIEKTHELLNEAEASLNECARSIDGNSNSLMTTLEKMAFAGVSIEEVDCVLADWNSLARKHGISAYSLPNCHMSLRQELDGNVEALQLLPEAEENERIALEEYTNACKELSDARKKVASELSKSVTNILPSLGLEGSAFQVQLSLRPGGFEDPYHGSENIGVDVVDFLLLHQKSADNGGNDNMESGDDALNNLHGGRIEQVGSSGEKSRVLLACETALPGSIGATCNSFTTSAENDVSSSSADSRSPPISIIYDEIDAHVGGRAAVTMAKLLADQSRSNRSSQDAAASSPSGNQIIAITHSASLAAISDRHIVVERGVNRMSSSLPIRTYIVDGSSRRKEIARMASGDLASGEAETFADALIRDALLHRETSPS